METLDHKKDPYNPSWWNVAFMPSNEKSWWDFLTKTWCRHVLAYGYVQRINSWVVVNPARYKTVVSIIPDDEFTDYLTYIVSEKSTILQIKGGVSKLHHQRILQNCSTVVARVIGIEGKALTPLMLFRTLKANNATVKTDPYNVDKVRSSRRRSRNNSAP